MIKHAEGVVLKTYDFRETSKIAVFFTDTHGKLKGLLKGIRKDHKKFGSSLDQFSVNYIVYYWHDTADIHLVGQCDLKQFYYPIRTDLKKMMAAQYICELINTIMPSEEVNKEVYLLTLNFLEALQTVKDINKLVHIFQIKILHLSGFRPHLDYCLICQRNIAKRVKFSVKFGGLICMDCLSNDPSAHAISQGAVASILHIEKNEWTKALRIGLSTPIKRELKYILNNFLVFHLEKQIKSARYLK